MERIETVIVGGGQAGLATSYFLMQQGREHIVLEQAAIAGNAWRNDRWDSFTLVTPNWALTMPGAEYDGPERDAFMPRAEVVAYFERYVERFTLPVQYDTRVLSIERGDRRGFRVVTPERTFLAEQVVVATGHEQRPRLPAFAGGLSPEVRQLHSSRYRNPAALPAGSVLVVGSGQSGAQIAEELYLAGREVFLSVGGAGRAPRRYRGRDIFEWLCVTGFIDITPEKLPFPKERFAAPHVSGRNGGHTLNLHQFFADGVTLLGHVRGAAGETIQIAPDLHEALVQIDRIEGELQQMIDGFIAANGLEAPEEALPLRREGFAQAIIETLDLRAAGIRTVIWATGFSHHYDFVKPPVLDGDGFPIQTRGVTAEAGLYFVGIPWTPSLKSGTLVGVAEAAAYVAGHVAGQRVEQEAMALAGV